MLLLKLKNKKDAILIFIYYSLCKITIYDIDVLCEIYNLQKDSFILHFGDLKLLFDSFNLHLDKIVGNKKRF